MEYLTVNRFGVLFEYQFSSRKLLLLAVFLNWILIGGSKVSGLLVIVYGVSSVVFAFEGVSATALTNVSAVFSSGGSFIVIGVFILLVGHLVASVMTEVLWRIDGRIERRGGDS